MGSGRASTFEGARSPSRDMGRQSRLGREGRAEGPFLTGGDATPSRGVIALYGKTCGVLARTQEASLRLFVSENKCRCSELLPAGQRGTGTRETR